MGAKVCAGALVKCSSGVVPIPLDVLPEGNTLTTTPAATILANTPINMPSFGVCANTLLPCVPITPVPWLVGAPTVLVAEQPALTQESQLICMLGGVIEILEPGQFTVETE